MCSWRTRREGPEGEDDLRRREGEAETLDLLALEVRGDVLALVAAAVDGVLAYLVGAEKLENLGLVGDELAVKGREKERNGRELEETEHVGENHEADGVVGDLKKKQSEGDGPLRIAKPRGAAPG